MAQNLSIGVSLSLCGLLKWCPVKWMWLWERKREHALVWTSVCMCVYIRVYACRCVWLCLGECNTLTWSSKNTLLFEQVCVCVGGCSGMDTKVCVYVWASVHLCGRKCVCVNESGWVCVWVCKTERERERKREKVVILVSCSQQWKTQNLLAEGERMNVSYLFCVWNFQSKKSAKKLPN